MVPAGAPPSWLQATHGVINMLTWGLTIPVGVLVARHMRTADADAGVWLSAHRAIQVSRAVGRCLEQYAALIGICTLQMAVQVLAHESPQSHSGEPCGCLNVPRPVVI